MCHSLNKPAYSPVLTLDKTQSESSHLKLGCEASAVCRGGHKAIDILVKPGCMIVKQTLIYGSCCALFRNVYYVLIYTCFSRNIAKVPKVPFHI